MMKPPIHFGSRKHLQALPLIKTLGAGDPNKFVDQMEQLLPQLRDSLEKIRASLPAQKS